MALACLAAIVAMLGYLLTRDGAEYAAFKKLTATETRQAKYRTWALKSFVTMGLSSIAVLALIGRLDSLIVMPPEFSIIAPAVSRDGDFGEMAGGIALGIGGGIVIVLAIATVRRRRGGTRSAVPTIGDIEALLPRNGQERLWGALLSVNAGFSEEILFRLVLPLLLVTVFHSALIALLASLLAFAIMHRYQGWVGVIATGVLGAILTAIYLGSGQIWAAVAVHALIDLNGLVIMPWLREQTRATSP